MKYVFFWGHQKPKSGVSKSCFSQWYEAPFDSEGKHFLTAEHYMMYYKALFFGDTEAARKVLEATSPGDAKPLGRAVLGFDEAKWQEYRLEIVVKANLTKFDSSPERKEFLLSTKGRVLVEASLVDRIWGVGLAKDDAAVEDPNRWKGLNLLGFALMEVRGLLSQ